MLMGDNDVMVITFSEISSCLMWSHTPISLTTCDPSHYNKRKIILLLSMQGNAELNDNQEW